MAAEIVSTLVTAFTSTAQSIGTGCVSLFESIFMNADKTSISNLGIYLLVLAGVGFAFGLSKMIFGMVRNRG